METRFVGFRVIAHYLGKIRRWFYHSRDSVKEIKMNNDRTYMEHTIEISKKSRIEKGKTPLYVAAIVVKDERILDEAYRGEIADGDHAEYTLLERKLKGIDLSGATLYTTLEPCTKRGKEKTPCAKRIIQRRLGRVVIGIIDPNPDISGKGYLLLKDNNIAIDLFPNDLQNEIWELNKSFIKEQRSGKSGLSEEDWNKLWETGNHWI
jgi:pyrimidine deaminase RibD-like protein